MTAEGEIQHRGTVGEFVDDVFWSPHANPRSVWAFVALYPVFIAAIYRRSRPLLAVALLSIFANLAVVSPPETDDAWATRVVLGEQVWLERGLLSETGAVGITALGAMANLYTLRAAVKRQRLRTAGGLCVSMVFMFVFFDRMVKLYDAEGSVNSELESPAERTPVSE
ncbi:MULTISPECIES: DUF6653 family protein [Haloferax]|uniref:Uncharacterized protein n=2 Tax=Haloferax TaxID=2251 RepID=A0A6G1Z413_9EURY|nr:MULTISPECIES: DUF6653 family protein [Haloferax]KAB1188521.1 hypothetical protein Hfx1149_10935 [Haloferax sp. CBA1149]MRW81215.1 hypothetical protein [Haloferax marinisediminis]